MRRSEAVRLITAYCNLKTFKVVDAFSGDYVMTHEEGSALIDYLETNGIMHPPIKQGRTEIEELDDGTFSVALLKWEDEDNGGLK